jgi:hypothetical protein
MADSNCQTPNKGFRQDQQDRQDVSRSPDESGKTSGRFAPKSVHGRMIAPQALDLQLSHPGKGEGNIL